MDRILFTRIYGVLLGASLLISPLSAAENTNVIGANTNAAEVATNAAAAAEAAATQELLRAYLQIQEQLHTATLAIEQTRQQGDDAARRNVETISARLKLIEQALTAQREREAESAKKSHKLVLIVAGLFGGVGLLAMVLTAWFQLRAMNRLAQFTTHGGALLGHHPMGSLGSGDLGITSVHAAPLPASNLLGAIERLEQRFVELQNATRSSLPTHTMTQTNGEPQVNAVTDSARDERLERLSVLLGKGQALLNLDQVENALVSFNEALEVDQDNAEVLIKKGTCLERLKKLEEAIECYDRAIAADKGMTLAYLCKGGVYNQLERFSEALECYEQALRTQQKTSIASSAA